MSRYRDERIKRKNGIKLDGAEEKITIVDVLSFLFKDAILKLYPYAIGLFIAYQIYKLPPFY